MTPEDAVDLAHLCFGGEGGQSSVVRTLNRQFQRLGFKTGVIAVAESTSLITGSGLWDYADRIVHIELSRPRDLRSMVDVAVAAKSLRPRVLLVHSHRHGPAAWFGLRMGGRKSSMITVEHHAIDLRSKRENVSSAMSALLSRAVVVLSADYARRYPLRHLIRNMVVIPNGVDASAEPIRVRPQGGPIILGMAGRFERDKDHRTLILALAKLNALHPMRFRLRLAGEGSQRREVESLVEQEGLSSAVDFLGHVDARSMRDFYASLDLYVQSTNGETMCLSLLEAAAVGLPIVASDVVGIHDLFPKSALALAKPGDPNAMAENILATIRSGPRADLRDYVVANYSTESMAAGYLTLLRRLDQ